MFLGDGQPEDAHPGQLFDDLHRDQLVALVPALGGGNHLFLGKAAELVADHLQLVVEARGDGSPVAEQADQPQPRRIPGGGDQRAPGLAGLVVEPEVARPRHLALAHRDAAAQLRQVFAEADLQDELLRLAQPPLAREAARPGVEFVQRLHIGRRPGEAMGGGLMGLQRLGLDLAGDADPVGQGRAHRAQMAVERRQDRSGQAQRIGQNCGGKVLGVQHVILRILAAGIEALQSQRNIIAHDAT